MVVKHIVLYVVCCTCESVYYNFINIHITCTVMVVVVVVYYVWTLPIYYLGDSFWCETEQRQASINSKPRS